MGNKVECLKLSVPIKSWTFLFRLIMLPGVFVYAAFILFCITAIPIGLFVVAYSIFAIICNGLIWALKRCGSEINYFGSMFDRVGIFSGNFIGATCYIWYFPVVLGAFLIKGKLVL